MMRPLLRRALLSTLALALLLVAVDALFLRGHPSAPHLKTLTPVHATGQVPHGFALLVNGGLGLHKNHPRYWNNLSLSYVALKTLGWRRIVVLDADGTPGAPDRNARSFLGLWSVGQLTDSPVDLDGDGERDVQGPATRSQLEASLGQLGREMGPGDFLTVYLIDHGQLRWRGGLSSVFMLWHEELTSAELEAMLDRQIPKSAWVALVGSMCHSGIFFHPMRRPNTLFIAAGYPLWIWSDQDYSVFVYHFAEALLHRVPDTGEALAREPAGEAPVSFQRAFDSAVRRDHAPEWPRLWANGDRSSAPVELQ